MIATKHCSDDSVTSARPTTACTQLRAVTTARTDICVRQILLAHQQHD